MRFLKEIPIPCCKQDWIPKFCVIRFIDPFLQIKTHKMLGHCYWPFIESFNLISVVLWVAVHKLWQLFITDIPLHLVVLIIFFIETRKVPLSWWKIFLVKGISCILYCRTLPLSEKPTFFPIISCKSNHKIYIYYDF